MKRKTRNLLLSLAAIVLLAAMTCGGAGYYLLFYPQFRLTDYTYLYIDNDDTQDSVICKLNRLSPDAVLTGFQCLAHHRRYAENIHTGRYRINPGDNIYAVFNRLYRAHQEPIMLTVGGVRTLDMLARNVGRQIMADSAEIASLMHDSLFLSSLGYTRQTLPALFMAESYEVYWNISAEAFFKRMQTEHRRFWNAGRLKKAEEMGLTPDQVCTLASIVAEETNNAAEKPVVAGLYMNRLKRGIPLQADPTIKFALQDFGLRRITNAQLQTDSPYNTYLNTGLPPGPIRIPSRTDIEAVLDYTHHNYIYMCAKEDFSGTHNFASNYTAHMRNARKYWKALNERKIYR